MLVTDTVVFIGHLPKELVAAFRATFEETADADLLLHVVYGSDARYEEQIATTEALLEELELQLIPRLLVFTKADAAPLGVAAALARAYDGVAIDARDGRTHSSLLARLRAVLDAPRAQRRDADPPPWAQLP